MLLSRFGVFFFLLSSRQQFCDWLLVSSLFCHHAAEQKSRGGGRKELAPSKLIE